jgi:hypothetical protein
MIIYALYYHFGINFGKGSTMKKILLLIVLFAKLMPAYTQLYDLTALLSDEQIKKHRIKSIKILAQEDYLGDAQFLTHEMNFNTQGMLTLTRELDMETGELLRQKLFSYDKHGYLINEQVVDMLEFKEEGEEWYETITYELTYEVDDNGRILKAFTDIEGFSTLNMNVRIYTYEQDILKSWVEMDTIRGVNRTTRFVYNQQQQLIREELVDEEGNQLGLKQWSYDDEGKLLSMMIVGKQSGIKQRCSAVFQYDESGRVTTMVRAGNIPGMSKGISLFEYHANGLPKIEKVGDVTRYVEYEFY